MRKKPDNTDLGIYTFADLGSSALAAKASPLNTKDRQSGHPTASLETA